MPLWPPDLKRLRNWSISGLERGSELEAGSPGERTYVERLAPGRFAGARTQHSEWDRSTVHCLRDEDCKTLQRGLRLRIVYLKDELLSSTVY